MEFKTKKELFKFLHTNKDKLIYQKKSTFKKADGVSFNNSLFFNYDKENEEKTYKANTAFVPEDDNFKVKAVINTTNWMDSHRDVHIPGLWKKSLQENKMIMHIQEHNMKFSHIISEGNDLKAYTKILSMKELGYNYDKNTEALIFDSIVRQERNEYMFKQYSKGYVKNHSVGMYYVNIVMAINDKGYGAEYEAWEKYFPAVINQDAAEEIGYFWAVKEAKVIEGSAVPMGSNIITPTMENNMKEEPSFNDTQYIVSPGETHEAKRIDFIKVLNNLKN